MGTVTYHDGTTATGAAPLPKRSPAEQERDHICSLRRQLKFLESRAGDRHTAREIPALRFAIETLDRLPAAIAAAVAAERERCAKLCESARFTGNTFPRTQMEQLRMDIAAAIRGN